MVENQSKFSILLFPWLAHGHIFPYLELAKNLSKKNFQIYFCSTAINLNSISQTLEKLSNIQLIELQLPSFPDLPPHYHTTKNVPPNLFPRLFQAFHMSKSTFTNIITSLNPDLLIYDAFQAWAAEIASSLSIPAVHFATSGATFGSLFYHNYFHSNIDYPFKEMYQLEQENKIFESISFSDILEKSDEDYIFSHMSLSSEIILMKTCRAIEGKYVDYLSTLCKKKIVSVGTLVARENNDQENDSDIIQWLNKKSRFSTVFIAFGSENYFTKNQMEEIAKGLEDSKVNFIWVVRFPVGDIGSIEESFLEKFLDRVKERGMIIKGWAPQADILKHSSIGGFISHCVMSSTMESVYFGVPMIGIPLKLDQPFNSRLVVDTGVGVEVGRDKNGELSGEYVKNAINKVISGKNSEQLKLKAEELRKKIRDEEDDEMNEAIEHILRMCKKYKQQQ